MHQVHVHGLSRRHYGPQSAALADKIAEALESVPGLTPENGFLVQTIQDHSGRKVPCLSGFAVCDDTQVDAADIKELMSLVAELLCMVLVEFAENYPVLATGPAYETITATAMCGPVCGRMDWWHPDQASEAQMTRMLTTMHMHGHHLRTQDDHAKRIGDERALERLVMVRTRAASLYMTLQASDVVRELQAARGPAGRE